MRHISALLVLVSFCGGQVPALPRLQPVDEARQDTVLAAVRDQLLASVRAGNARSVMSVVSPAIVLTGTRQPGDANWRSLDEMFSNPNHEWWKGLESALSLGGAFTTTRGAVKGRREFCAPYVYAAFPTQVPPEVSGEGSPWVIIDKDVAVHAEPNAKSRVLGRLSYALVQANGGEFHDPENYDVVWQTIDLPDDKEGFVRAAKIRNPEGYRVCLANESGHWLVSSFSRLGSP